MGWTDTRHGARALNGTIDGIALVDRASEAVDRLKPASVTQRITLLTDHVRREQPELSETDALTLVLSTKRELYDAYRREQEQGSIRMDSGRPQPANAKTTSTPPVRGALVELTPRLKAVVARAFARLEAHADECRQARRRVELTLRQCIQLEVPELSDEQAWILSKAAMLGAPVNYDGPSVRDVDNPGRVQPTSTAVRNHVDVLERIQTQVNELRQQNPLLSEDQARAEVVRRNPALWAEYCSAVSIPVR